MPSQDDVIEFNSYTYTKNDLADVIKTPVPRQVFATKLSVGQAEFYQANANGLKPEIKFEVWSLDYQGEKSFYYNNIPYNIIRTFERQDEFTEIVGSRGINKGVSNG